MVYSLILVDPFSGSCGNPNALFISPETYDTTFGILDYGLTHQNNLMINDLRERQIDEPPFIYGQDSDSVINFWAHIYGVRKGKEVTINWKNPSNTMISTFSYFLDHDYWYYYYWSYLEHQNLSPGQWNVELIYDDNKVLEQAFKIEEYIHSDTIIEVEIDYQNITGDNSNGLITDETVEVIDMLGRHLNYPLKLGYSSGVYVFIITKNNGKQWIIKKII